MALYHKWDVKNGFVYVLQFFSLISDGLDCVQCPFYIGTLILLFSKFSLSPYYCIIDTLGMYICTYLCPSRYRTRYVVIEFSNLTRWKFLIKLFHLEAICYVVRISNRTFKKRPLKLNALWTVLQKIKSVHTVPNYSVGKLS